MRVFPARVARIGVSLIRRGAKRPEIWGCLFGQVASIGTAREVGARSLVAVVRVCMRVRVVGWPVMGRPVVRQVVGPMVERAISDRFRV